MTRPLPLRDWEARTRPGVICRAMKPQPVSDDKATALYTGRQNRDGKYDIPVWAHGDPVPDSLLLFAPIQPGDRVWARETWADVNTEVPTLHGTCTEVRAMRAGSLAVDDFLALGLLHAPAWGGLDEASSKALSEWNVASPDDVERYIDDGWLEICRSAFRAEYGADDAWVWLYTVEWDG